MSQRQALQGRSRPVDRDKTYPLEDAVKIVKANAKAKFDETIEVAMNLGIDPRHADQAVRGMSSCPTAPASRCASRCSPGRRRPRKPRPPAPTWSAPRISPRRSTAARSNFDALHRHAGHDGRGRPLGKVLGPRGLMPNPKLGTVTQNVTAAVRPPRPARSQFRAEKAGIVHAGVGKASFTEEAIAANVKALVTRVIKRQAGGAKGTFIKKVSLRSTMGPGVKLDPATALN